jgi:hypothetical protein
MQKASYTKRLSRSLDLLLWSTFGEGARLRSAQLQSARRTGLLARLFALLGLPITR